MVAFAFLPQNFGRYRGPTNVSQNSLNLVTKIFVIRVKELEPATTCVV